MGPQQKGMPTTSGKIPGDIVAENAYGNAMQNHSLDADMEDQLRKKISQRFKEKFNNLWVIDSMRWIRR